VRLLAQDLVVAPSGQAGSATPNAQVLDQMKVRTLLSFSPRRVLCALLAGLHVPVCICGCVRARLPA
jgi:hypothetical protein